MCCLMYGLSGQSISLTVHSPYSIKRTRCETASHPFMALKRDLLLDFRHCPYAIFSNIASFALKAAGGDDWLKRNIHHETPCILLSSMMVNTCVGLHQRVQCMTVLYKTTGGILRSKTEVHTALLPTNRRR